MANGRKESVQQDMDLLDDNALKKILNQTIGTIEDNKEQIFHIYETARDAVERARELLRKLKEQARQTIEEVDRLTAEEQQKKQDAESELRRSQIGTGDRSEKIRTYNFPQGRVTDHRINLTLYKLDKIMNGDIQEIIDACITADQAKKLANMNE